MFVLEHFRAMSLLPPCICYFGEYHAVILALKCPQMNTFQNISNNPQISRNNSQKHPFTRILVNHLFRAVLQDFLEIIVLEHLSLLPPCICDFNKYHAVILALKCPQMNTFQNNPEQPRIITNHLQ